MMRNRKEELVDGMKGLKSQLAQKEKAREELQAALSKAQREVKRHSRAVVGAEGDLAVAEAAAVSGGWSETREQRRKERALEDLRGGFAEARKDADAKQDALDRVMDEIGEIQAALAGPRSFAIRKRAIELASLLRRQQEDALETARRMAALYGVIMKETPRRLVRRRAPNRFLEVVIDDPKILALLHANEKIRPPFVNTYREYFTALKGAKENRWRIVDGQDMILRKGEIEEEWTDGPTIPEVAKFRELNLGSLFLANGRAPTGLEKEELDFHTIDRLVTDEDLLAAVRSIEEGA